MTCHEYIEATVQALMRNPVPNSPLYQDDPVAAWRYVFRVIGHGLAEYDERDVRNEITALYSRVVVKHEFGSRRGVTVDNNDIIAWMMDARQEHLDRMDELKAKRVDMSGKYVTVEWSDKHKYYFLSWGNETFYDHENYLRTWKTATEAADWLRENHPELLLVEVNRPDNRVTFADEFERIEAEQMELNLPAAQEAARSE